MLGRKDAQTLTMEFSCPWTSTAHSHRAPRQHFSASFLHMRTWPRIIRHLRKTFHLKQEDQNQEREKEHSDNAE